MTNQYEFVFLTNPALSGKKKETLFSSLEKEIKNLGGKVEKKEDMGLKRLAFEIKDQKEAAFNVWGLQFKDSFDFSSVNLFINREEEIIRYLFLRKAK